MGKLKDVEIEKFILGIIFLDNKLSYKLDELNENMFMNDICFEIFKIMKEFKKENIVIDVVIVKLKIDRKFLVIKISDVINLIIWG